VTAKNYASLTAIATATANGSEVKIDKLPCCGIIKRSSLLIALRYKIDEKMVIHPCSSCYVFLLISVSSDPTHPVTVVFSRAL